MGVESNVKSANSTRKDSYRHETKLRSDAGSCHPYHGKRAYSGRRRWKGSEGALSVRRLQQQALLRWHTLQEQFQSTPARSQSTLSRPLSASQLMVRAPIKRYSHTECFSLHGKRNVPNVRPGSSWISGQRLRHSETMFQISGTNETG